MNVILATSVDKIHCSCDVDSITGCYIIMHGPSVNKSVFTLLVLSECGPTADLHDVGFCFHV